jgi:exosome complex RNA-binding protein Csl4
MDLIAGLAATAKGLEIAKALRDIDRSMESAEYRSRIADLIDQLTDAKIALSEAKETIAEKDAEIRRLSDVQAAKVQTLRNKDGFNFGLVDGQVNPLPFCPTCEQEGKQVMFSELGSGTVYCSKCKRVEQRRITPPQPPKA